MNTHSFLWIFGFILLQRLYEVLRSRWSHQELLKTGALEYHPESFRNIALMHAAFFVSLLVESSPWLLPWNVQTWFCLAVVLTLAGLRLWCMFTLQPYWNVRIIVVPGAHVTTRGPYRLLRHPNYLIVILEFLFYPLLLRAPYTMVVFTILNLVLLRQRIHFEEAALRAHTDYEKAFNL